MGRTGTLALTGQSRRCSDDDVVFALGEDDEGEVEEEVEWDEPMVSVRDLDWKRDGSLGFTIMSLRSTYDGRMSSRDTR